jgi:hypothetical protein
MFRSAFWAFVFSHPRAAGGSVFAPSRSSVLGGVAGFPGKRKVSSCQHSNAVACYGKG